jgi:hypothetical protein
MSACASDCVRMCRKKSVPGTQPADYVFFTESLPRAPAGNRSIRSVVQRILALYYFGSNGGFEFGFGTHTGNPEGPGPRSGIEPGERIERGELRCNAGVRVTSRRGHLGKRRDPVRRGPEAAGPPERGGAARRSTDHPVPDVGSHETVPRRHTAQEVASCRDGYSPRFPPNAVGGGRTRRSTARAIGISRYGFVTRPL